MLIRHRIPSLTYKRTCCKTRQYTTQPPVPPITRKDSVATEPETIPPVWPSPTQAELPQSSLPPVTSKSPLQGLAEMLTTKDPINRPKRSSDISTFKPATEKAFYPQAEGVILKAISQPKPSRSQTPTQLEERPNHAYHIYINNSTKNTHITITNHKRDPVLKLSAGRLGLKHSKRATHEAGAATAEEALRQFMEKLPKAKDDVRIELILKGFGPGRRGALATILGPMGEEIRSRISRVTDATNLSIGGVRVKNKRRR
jgi:ribosomal protein S11